MIRATVHEAGNGLPDVGDFVAGDDGEVYAVESIDGRIQTGSRSGEGSWVHATVSPADWQDVTDDTEPTCSAILEKVSDPQVLSESDLSRIQQESQRLHDAFTKRTASMEILTAEDIRRRIT